VLRPFALPLVLLGALLAPASAHAGVVRAEGVLPPGQSGYVSIPGVASGTGSPHLTDQVPLFADFRRKPFLFNQPGRTEQAAPTSRSSATRSGCPR
jgi:hypothetical protein